MRRCFLPGAAARFAADAALAFARPAQLKPGTLGGRHVRIDGVTGYLELERCELGSGNPADTDVLLNVTVRVRGFAAEVQAWVLGAEWAQFVSDLRRLERDRRGRATVEGMSPDEFRMEVFSTDPAGHMALTGTVRRPHVEGFTLALEFGFAFEPDLLPQIVRDLTALGHA